MANPRILFLDNELDLYDLGFVDKTIKIIEQRTFQRDKLIDSEYSFTVKNFGNEFTEDNPVSFIYGQAWLYQPLKIYNTQEELVWDGQITNIETDHLNMTATITSRSKLSVYANQIITYKSAAYETPADVVKNVLTNYSFADYDAATMARSIAVMTTNGLKVSVTVNPEDGMTLLAIIEKMADYSCSDAYLSSGKVYFKHFEPYVSGAAIHLTEKKLYGMPKITSLYGDMINDYTIDYVTSAGVPATDATQGNLGGTSRTRYGTHSMPQIDGGIGKSVIFETAAAAKYLGECYIRRTHRTLTTNPRSKRQVTFAILAQGEDWVDLQTYFKLSFTDQAWVEKIFEIYGTELDEDNNLLTITAVEVE